MKSGLDAMPLFLLDLMLIFPAMLCLLLSSLLYTRGLAYCSFKFCPSLMKKLTKGIIINVASVFNRHLITLVYAPLIDQAGGTSLTSSNTHIFVIL